MRTRLLPWTLLALAVALGLPAAVIPLAAQGIVAPQAPPPPQVESPGPPPNPGAIWIAGHWTWRGEQFAWEPGRWETARSGQAWVPGRWKKTGSGFTWEDGRWRQ